MDENPWAPCYGTLIFINELWMMLWTNFQEQKCGHKKSVESCTWVTKMACLFWYLLKNSVLKETFHWTFWEIKKSVIKYRVAFKEMELSIFHKTEMVPELREIFLYGPQATYYDPSVGLSRLSIGLTKLSEPFTRPHCILAQASDKLCKPWNYKLSKVGSLTSKNGFLCVSFDCNKNFVLIDWIVESFAQ